jgi:hypothetical protein
MIVGLGRYGAWAELIGSTGAPAIDTMVRPITRRSSGLRSNGLISGATFRFFALVETAAYRVTKVPQIAEALRRSSGNGFRSELMALGHLRPLSPGSGGERGKERGELAADADEFFVRAGVVDLELLGMEGGLGAEG